MSQIPFEFDVTIHNLSNQDKSVRYETTLQTDQVQDGKFTLHPRLLETLDGKETVTISQWSADHPRSS